MVENSRIAIIRGMIKFIDNNIEHYGHNHGSNE